MGSSARQEATFGTIGPPWTTARQAASQYNFVPAPGRERVIAAFDTLLDVLRGRVAEHVEHGQRDLEALTRNLAQRVMTDLDQFCQKWEEADRRGLTY